MKGFVRCSLFVLVLSVCGSTCAADGQWLTVAYKRDGFINNYQAKYAGGVGAAVRVPFNLPVKTGTIRVWFRHSNKLDLHLTRCALLREDGRTVRPITFKGATRLTLTADKRSGALCSDILKVKLSAGRHFIEQVYADRVYPFTKDVDGSIAMAPGTNKQKVLKGHRPGCFYRVDIWCKKPPTTLVCYGDSITQGYGATAGAGARYPDRLAALLGRPTLNLGVNGQLLRYSNPDRDLSECEGIGAVVLLMGINDINWRRMDLALYKGLVNRFVAARSKAGLPVYVGTLTPGMGFRDFDASREQLRQNINTWIRSNACKATAIIDFDIAVRDPKQPERMRADLHCGDWLHPSDAGYEVMAKVAAAVIRSERRTSTKHATRKNR